MARDDKSQLGAREEIARQSDGLPIPSGESFRSRVGLERVAELDARGEDESGTSETETTETETSESGTRETETSAEDMRAPTSEAAPRGRLAGSIQRLFDRLGRRKRAARADLERVRSDRETDSGLGRAPAPMGSRAPAPMGKSAAGIGTSFRPVRARRVGKRDLDEGIDAREAHLHGELDAGPHATSPSPARGLEPGGRAPSARAGSPKAWGAQSKRAIATDTNAHVRVATHAETNDRARQSDGHAHAGSGRSGSQQAVKRASARQTHASVRGAASSGEQRGATTGPRKATRVAGARSRGTDKPGMRRGSSKSGRRT